MAKHLVEVTYDNHLVDSEIRPEQLAGYLEQLADSDSESRAYEEAHGYLDPDDKLFTVRSVRAVKSPEQFRVDSMESLENRVEELEQRERAASRDSLGVGGTEL